MVNSVLFRILASRLLTLFSKTPDSEKTQAEDWLTRVIAPKVITLFDWAHCQPEGFDDHAANLMYLLRECQNAYHHNPGSQERRDRQFDVHRYVVRACIHKIHTRIAYHSAAATEKAVSCIAFDDFGHLLAPKAGWKLEMEDMLKGLKDFRTSQVSQLLLQRMQVPRSEMMEKDWEALTFKDEELEEACRMPGVAIDGYKEDSIKTAAGRQAVYESFTNYVWRAIFLATLLKQDFFFDKESLKKDTTGDRAGSVSQLFEALSKALLRLSVKIRNPVLQIILQEVLKDAQRNDSARDKAYEEGELEHLEMADLGGMEQLSAYTEKVLRWIALFTQHTACTLFITNSRILRRNHFSADRLVHILETSTSDKLRDQEAKQPYEMVSIPKIISDLGLKLDRVHSEALIRR